jgi:hypothetical protein
VVGPEPPAHDIILCVAPPRQVDTDNVVVVVVDGQSSTPLPLQFAAPSVTSSTPPEVDAVPPQQGEAAGPRRVVMHGVNFGVRYRSDVPISHTIMLGPYPCTDVAWQSNTALICTPNDNMRAGVYNVTVAVAGQASIAPFVLRVSCPRGHFGQAGEGCTPCPDGALCSGRDKDPVAARGFFPLSRTLFAACVPPEACAGGVSAQDLAGGAVAISSACSKHYVGDQCSQCDRDARRVKDRCVACPRTEWLLYTSLVLGCVGAGAAAVYVRRKRISLSGLSLGLVRGTAYGARQSWTCFCIDCHQPQVPCDLLWSLDHLRPLAGLHANAVRVCRVRFRVASRHQGSVPCPICRELQP